MKLDHKRTVLVGLAFLSICAFWQMYDNIIPLILTNTFHLDETISGAIMAADNVLALFLLPFFGALSDRTSTKIGRRMPFILGGTAAAVILMNLLPLFDNGYANGASTGKLAMFVVTLGLLLVAMGTYRSPAVALMPDVTPKPIRSRANAIINLMGAVGGISYLIVAAVLYPQVVKIAQNAAHYAVQKPDEVTDLVDFKQPEISDTDLKAPIYIDFGPTSLSATPWNNITSHQESSTTSWIKDVENNYTNIGVRVLDGFTATHAGVGSEPASPVMLSASEAALPPEEIETEPETEGAAE